MENKIRDNHSHQIFTNMEALSNTLHKLNHDVREPIYGIIGLTNLLIEDKEQIKVRTKDIAMIKESAELIIDIIDEVLAGRATINNDADTNETEAII